MKRKIGLVTFFIAIAAVIFYSLYTDPHDKEYRGWQKGVQVSYRCMWCKEKFTGTSGELVRYYQDESSGRCMSEKITRKMLTGFCSVEHCDLYQADAK